MKIKALSGIADIIGEHKGQAKKIWMLGVNDLIKKYNPYAEIWCISPAVSTHRSDPLFQFPYYLGGIHLREYAEAIGRVAAEKGCVFVDANLNEKPVTALDGIHPDKAGMMTLAGEILKARGIL